MGTEVDLYRLKNILLPSWLYLRCRIQETATPGRLQMESEIVPRMWHLKARIGLLLRRNISNIMTGNSISHIWYLAPHVNKAAKTSIKFSIRRSGRDVGIRQQCYIVVLTKGFKWKARAYPECGTFKHASPYFKKETPII